MHHNPYGNKPGNGQEYMHTRSVEQTVAADRLARIPQSYAHAYKAALVLHPDLLQPVPQEPRSNLASAVMNLASAPNAAEAAPQPRPQEPVAAEAPSDAVKAAQELVQAALQAGEAYA